MSAATGPLPPWVDMLLIDDAPYRVVAAPGGDAVLLDSGEDPEFISTKDKSPRGEPEPLALSEVKRMLHRPEPTPTPLVRPVTPMVTAPNATQPPAAVPRPSPPSPAPSGTWTWLVVLFVAGAAIGAGVLARRLRQKPCAK
jgi:hypothetical protein